MARKEKERAQKAGEDALIMQSEIFPKEGKSSKGALMHYSVGAIIKKDSKYFLIDRKKEPFGFACVAGHVDEGEDAISALKREINEECGLSLKGQKLLFEEELDWNVCRRKITVHYWHVFLCDVEGEVKFNKDEAKSVGWYTFDQIKQLSLEPVWEYWFNKLT